MKKIGREIIAVILVLVLIISCDNEKSISEEEMKAIVENCNAKLGECFKLGDADKLAEMYAPSAKLSPNGYNFVFGRDSIKKFWTEDFKTSKVVEMITDVKTIDGDREVIYETGISSSKILFEDSLYHVTVKYINVWRKQPEGKYLLDVDFWNSTKR